MRIERWSRGWPRLTAGAVALLLARAGAAADPAPEAAQRVEVRTAAGRALTGSVLVEAVDGGLLLELEDGGYTLLQPPDIAARRPAPAAAVPADPEGRDLGRRILADLPPGFDVLVTKHYVVCFATSRDYAKWCAALFERLHDAFVNYWRRAGLEVVDPPRRMVVVLFGDRRAYEAHAAGAVGDAADRVVGFYDLMSNRVTSFDLTGTDATAAAARPPGRTGLDILSSPAAASQVATLVHEATHQMAFNCGMHRRLAPVPLWVSEGIATYFETPDLENTRGWRGIGGVNGPRLDRFLTNHRAGAVEAAVRGDEVFRDADSAVDAYATAWATVHHLLQTRKQAFVGYLRVLAEKRPLADDQPARRVEEFRAAFGDPAAVEAEVVRAMARLASLQR